MIYIKFSNWKQNAHMVNISSLPLLPNEPKAKPNKQIVIRQVRSFDLQVVVLPQIMIGLNYCFFRFSQVPDQIPGTSINPRERPRGQLALHPQAFNLTPPALALVVSTDSSSSNHISHKVEGCHSVQ